MKKPSAIILLGALLLITPQLQSCNILPSISQQQINPKLSPEELQQLASAITVKIIGGEAGGSGTIIRKVGSTYTVVTNQHVLQAVQGTSKYRIDAGKIVKNIRIQTSDGLDYPATIVKGENINFQDKDLGLLEFNADRTYDVGTFAKPDVALKPGEKVWAAGFPSEPPLLKGGQGGISLSNGGQFSSEPPADPPQTPLNKGGNSPQNPRRIPQPP
ncbi:serine protease [[Phormidium] sp. ETS-05]|uniref:S1 family peptidase n=1 Tax=[Phormidium] sp. ETS-05 TaxID=222819 RepID=UPI0018EED586|nr:serine protease [[Phormidium] sp. ETS-05]